MYFTGNMQRRGCAACAVGNNNFTGTFSSNFYNNKFSNNYKENSNINFPENSYSLYNNRAQRIMTPPRNIYNMNMMNMDNNYFINTINPHNYYSPSRNTGCRDCSINSSQIFNGINQRPSTGYFMRRNNNNINTYNNINYNRDYNNDFNLRRNYDYNNDFKKNQNNNEINRNIPLNQNRYYSPIRIPQRNENIINNKNSYNQNRYFSPIRSPPRNNLIRSFSNSNINNYSYSINNNKNYTNNDKYNNNDNFNESISNNKFRNYLDNNINRYKYDNRNDNNMNKKYYSPSISHNIYNNNSNYNINDYSNLRNNSLLFREKYENNNERFIELNIFNYQKKIREMIIDRKSFFVFIYGAEDYTGKSWCSDCTIARPIVEEAKNIIKERKFEKEVYFISIPIDKSNMIDLKYDSTSEVERVPTLIYFENGREKNRLIENDLFSYQNVNSFIFQAYNQFNNNIRRNNYLYSPKNYY